MYLECRGMSRVACIGIYIFMSAHAVPTAELTTRGHAPPYAPVEPVEFRCVDMLYRTSLAPNSRRYGINSGAAIPILIRMGSSWNERRRWRRMRGGDVREKRGLRKIGYTRYEDVCKMRSRFPPPPFSRWKGVVAATYPLSHYIHTVL